MLIRGQAFRRLCQARDLLADRSEPPRSVADVARVMQISPFHFIRQFQTVFGVTPHQFKIEARLDAAKRLLVLGHHSVTDVCFDVGFSSLGSFSTLFTRRIGEPPSAYQRRLRGVVAVPGTCTALTPGCLTLMGHLPASAFDSAIRNFREARTP